MKKEIMTKSEFVNSMNKILKLNQVEHKKIKDLLKDYELNRQQSVVAVREEKKKH